MKTKIKYAGLTAVALAAGIAIAPNASAQAVAVANPQGAVFKSTPFVNAMNSIRAANKPALDQSETLQKEVDAFSATFDANGDKQLDQGEQTKMRAAPGFAAIAAKANQIDQLRAPAARAQAYVLEQLNPKFQQAFKNVVAANKVSLVLTPEAALFADNSADITDLITEEINKLQTTAVNTTPPATWQAGGAGAGAGAGGPPAPRPPLPTGTPKPKPTGR